MFDPSMGKIGLLSGSGFLPVWVAQNIVKQGFALNVYAGDHSLIKAMTAVVKPTGGNVVPVWVGRIQHVLDRLKADNIKAVVFVGKVNKWALLKTPGFDAKAWEMWRRQQEFNDDALMLLAIQELAAIDITVLEQTRFMDGLFIGPGHYSDRVLSEREEADVLFGMDLAREMGRLDIGQTVVVSNGMVLAVEAVEGTDEAIRRAGRFKNKHGGIVAKVEKPNQDKRFDVPTVGPRTLNAVKKAGLTVLAVEAHKTIVLEQDKMMRLARQWQISLVAK